MWTRLIPPQPLVWQGSLKKTSTTKHWMLITNSHENWQKADQNWFFCHLWAEDENLNTEKKSPKMLWTSSHPFFFNSQQYGLIKKEKNKTKQNKSLSLKCRKQCFKTIRNQAWLPPLNKNRNEVYNQTHASHLLFFF